MACINRFGTIVACLVLSVAFMLNIGAVSASPHATHTVDDQRGCNFDTSMPRNSDIPTLET